MCPLYKGDDNEQKQHFTDKGFRPDCNRSSLANEYVLQRHVEARHSRLHGFLEREKARELAEAQIAAAKGMSVMMGRMDDSFRATKAEEPQAAEASFPCDECDLVAKSNSGLGAHKRSKHPKEE